MNDRCERVSYFPIDTHPSCRLGKTFVVDSSGVTSPGWVGASYTAFLLRSMLMKKQDDLHKAFDLPEVSQD